MKRYMLMGTALLIVFACGFVVGKEPWNHEEKPVIPYIKILETTYEDMMEWDPGILGEGLELSQGTTTYHHLSDGTILEVIYTNDGYVNFYKICNEDRYRN